MMRGGIRTLIEREPDLTVSGEADDAEAALRALNDRLPLDLVLLDLSLPGMSGLDLLKHIRSLYPALPVLVLSAHEEAVYADRVVRAGAQGYVSKNTSSEDIIAAIRTVLSGGLALSETLKQRILTSGAANDETPLVGQLSDRELEVFEHIGYGRSTAAIAEAMYISRKTVESHRLNIKKKVGVETSNQLVQRAAVWVATRGVPPAK